jgi:spermidine synthase
VKKQSPHEAVVALTPDQRGFLYATAGITGAAILVVEILGAKMLAPFLGTSHFVWTAQIGVTLLSLAVGYAWGGWLVDRSPKLTRLYACLLAAAVYLVLTVPLCEPVAYGCLRFNLAVGSLLAAAFLFFVPLTLLATVVPFLMRVLTTSLGTVGRQAGRLSAVSTVGSVVGTSLIGYVLIPFLANSTTMLLTAGVLTILAVTYFLGWGRKHRQQPGALFGLGLVLLGSGLAVGVEGRSRFADVEQIASLNSNFGKLQVLQTRDGGRRYYLNDYLVQNTYDTAERRSASLFTYMLHDLARAYTERIDAALCIGLGIGIVPGQFAREGVRVEVAEINPVCVRVAKEHFNFDPQGVTIHVADGRQILNQTTQRFDAVILDAFLGDSSPSHLMTREAFGAMRRVLNPHGTLVINAFGDFDSDRDFFVASLHRTLAAVFASVRILAAGNGNVFFVASARSPLEPFRTPDFDAMHPAVRHQARAAWESQYALDPSHGRVLTDDFNPVEFYDAANRERMRRQFAFSVRDW